MDEHREEEPGRGAGPLPRDLPDQQTREGEDPWDVPTGPEGPRATDDAAREEDGGGSADVPDTDEAGTGRRDAPRSGGTDTDAPPEESTG